MAGTAVLKAHNNSPDKLGVEVMKVVLGAGDTTATISPTDIEWIDFITITPLDAASAAAGVPYLASFAVGASSATLTGANSTQYLVKVEGKVS